MRLRLNTNNIDNHSIKILFNALVGVFTNKEFNAATIIQGNPFGGVFTNKNMRIFIKA